MYTICYILHTFYVHDYCALSAATVFVLAQLFIPSFFVIKFVGGFMSSMDTKRASCRALCAIRREEDRWHEVRSDEIIALSPFAPLRTHTNFYIHSKSFFLLFIACIRIMVYAISLFYCCICYGEQWLGCLAASSGKYSMHIQDERCLTISNTYIEQR